MKFNFKKMILPLAVVAFGIVGAISTNAMNKKSTALVDRWGYTHDENGLCVDSEIMCSTNPGPPCLGSSSEPLYDFISTVSCPNPLNVKQ